MEQIGWSLVDSSNHEIQFWGDTAGECPGIPNPIFLSNGDQVFGASLGPIGSYKLAERWLSYGSPESIAFDGAKTVVTRTAPTPAAVPPTLVAAALNMNVVNGDIPGIDGPFNIGAAAYIDVGQYWGFFSEAQPDANYFADISGAAPVIVMTDHGTDYFVIEARSSAGGPFVDASIINVKIYRI